MEYKVSKTILGSLITTTLLLVGCGGGDSDTVATAVTQVGTFVDVPVQGLAYKTATQSGFTDASGQFKYIVGERVEFKLGNLSLGEGNASGLVTPYIISENNETATNIALLLQNFDRNRSNATTLDLSLLQDANLSDVNLSASATAMELLVGNLFSDARFAANYSGSVLLDATTVKGTMDTFINANSIQYDKKFTQSYLDANDFYAKDSEYGSKIQRFDGGQLYYAGDTYIDDTTGLIVHGLGYDGVFNIDGSGVAAYTITDGVISIGYGGGSFVVTTKLLSVSDNYIEVSQVGSDGTTKTVKWYTNKAAAKTAYSTDLVSGGFTQAFLNSHDMYILEADDAHIKRFQNGYIYHAGDLNGNNLADLDAQFDMISIPTATYAIVNGILVGNFNGTEVTFEILGATDTTITVKGTLGTTTRTDMWYIDRAAAKTAFPSIYI